MLNKKLKNNLTTIMIARAVKCHPNTVRLYEKWGYLQQVPRRNNGYRIFSKKHLVQMILARTALPGPYPGGGTPVYNLVKEAAKYNFDKALQLALKYQLNVREENRKAQSVLKDIEKWTLLEKKLSNHPLIYTRCKISQILSLSIDTLRTWERNELLHIEKNKNGYCIYSDRDISRLKIIHTLRTAGYSISSIRKMFMEYDNGKIINISKKVLANILNTPDIDAPIIYVTDMWLTTLKEHQKRSIKIINLLKSMMNNHV